MSESYFFNSRLAHAQASTYVTDKELSTKTYIGYMSLRLQKMFHYEGLPPSIPREMLENYLLNNGTCFITKVDGELYALIGSYGGPPDAYYRPTLYVTANPALRLTESYDLVKDGVLMRNDSLWIGLYPMMARYATLMAENFLTLRVADVMLRVMALFTAPDDKTKIAAEEYLKNLENGKLGVIGENRFFDDGVKMQSPPSNNGSYLTQFIELHQYLTGTFYNEIGLNANFNMKRESIGDGESSLNEDSLLPLSEDMLRCRKEDVEKINVMFGTSITVEFDSSWQNNQKEIAFELEKLKKEASQLADGEGDDDASGTGDNGETINSDDEISDVSTGESDGDSRDNVGECDGVDGERDVSDNSDVEDVTADGDDGGDDKKSKASDDDKSVEEKEEKEDDDDGHPKD